MSLSKSPVQYKATDKLSSPLLSVINHLKQMRNQEKDYLMGKVLTLLDGLIVNERQNKAIKDLAKNIFWEPNYIWEDMEEILGQFKDKFCTDVEKDCQHKIERNSECAPNRNFLRGITN